MAVFVTVACCFVVFAVAASVFVTVDGVQENDKHPALTFNTSLY